MRTGLYCCTIAFACVGEASFAQEQQVSPLSLDASVDDPSGSCRSGAGLGHASLLLGWQTSSTLAFRALGGVAYYGDDIGKGSAAGLEGRLDVGLAFLAHLALALSTRAALLPNVRGQSVSMFAATLGVRLH